jgi:hypothetical protein
LPKAWQQHPLAITVCPIDNVEMNIAKLWYIDFLPTPTPWSMRLLVLGKKRVNKKFIKKVGFKDSSKIFVEKIRKKNSSKIHKHTIDTFVPKITPRTTSNKEKQYLDLEAPLVCKLSLK